MSPLIVPIVTLVVVLLANCSALNFPRLVEYRNRYQASVKLGPQPAVRSFFTDGRFVVVANPAQLYDPVNYGPGEIDLYGGKGVQFKVTKPFVRFNVRIENETLQNVCGVMISVVPSEASAAPTAFYIQSRYNPAAPYKTYLNPAINGTLDTSTLMKFYTADMPDAAGNVKTFFIDSMPADDFNIAILAAADANVSAYMTVKMAFVHSCYHLNTVYIASCGEMIYGNPRFEVFPDNTPIHIRCPVDCVQARPCWGYRTYTTDSALCLSAVQMFGRSGTGLYTIYKTIGAYFLDQIDPTLNNRIYCRAYSYPDFAYSFEYNINVQTRLQYNKFVATVSG